MATCGLNEAADSVGSMGLECPICLEVYKDPRALACLHTFCLDVLILKAKEEGKLKDGIDCPICRTRTNINKDLSPEQWRGLPRNYALAAALQTLHNGSEMDTNPLWQSCIQNNETHKASMFCLSCAQYQCEDCVAIHKRFNSMKAHTIVELDDNKETIDMVDFTHLLHCHEHNKLIEFYCTDHELLCCTTCAIITHKRCDNIEIRNVNKEVNDKDVKRDMAHMIRNIEHVCRKMTQNENDINCDLPKMEDRLTSIRRKVLERLNKFEKDIRDEMQNKKQSAKSVNDKIRVESNCLIAALEGSNNMINTVTQKGSSEARFVTIEKLRHQCQMYRTSIDELFVEAKAVHMQLNVDDSLIHVSESNGKLGTMEIVSEKFSAFKKIFNLKTMKCIDMNSKDGREEPLITGIGFFSDGRIIMVDNKNDECLIMDDSLVQLTFCKLSFKPLGLAVLTTDEILITACKSVHRYIVDRDNVLTHPSSTKLHLKCRSISEIDKDTVAVSYYNTNIPVSKVTRQGKVSQIVGEYPDVKYGICETTIPYSRMDDCLVLALSELNEIRVVDTKYKTTTVIKDDNMIKSPSGVVVANGNSRSFYVCCQDTHSIVRISFDGIILGNHKLTDMHFPRFIAISDDNGKLIVCNNTLGNMKVRLYKLRCDQ